MRSALVVSLMLGALPIATNAEVTTRFGVTSMIDAGVADPAPREDVMLRRLRVGASVAAQGFRLSALVGVETEDPTLISATASWHSGAFAAQVGRMQEPFSHDQQRSSSRSPFLERAIDNLFAPGYSEGALARFAYQRFVLTAGAFGGRLGEVIGEGLGDRAYGARATRGFGGLKNGLFHVGVAYTHRRPQRGIVDYGSYPESRLGNSSWIDTRDLADVDTADLLRLEAAYATRRWLVLAEATETRLNRPEPDRSGRSRGAHLELSFVPSGARQSYSRSRGVFTGIDPAADRIVWEWVGRLSWVDLGDISRETDRARGMEIGVNAYFGRSHKLMLHAIEQNRHESGDRDRQRFVQLRYQWVWRD